MSRIDVDFDRDFAKPEDLDPFQHQGMKHDVWVGGTGPPVIVLHELDGFRKPVIQLAERLAGRGLRIYLPRFYGRTWMPESLGNLAGLVKVCVRREFSMWATGKASPVADWVRALAAEAARREAAPNVGVVGMCLTGGIALAAVTEPAVGAAVAAQPSLPWATGFWPFDTANRRKDLGLSRDDLAAIRTSGTPILGLRFCGDRISPEERMCEVAKLPETEIPPIPGEGHATLTALYRKSTLGHIGSDEAIARTGDFLTEKLGG